MKNISMQVALVSIFAALYAAASFLPISVYIGGEGLITANVVVLPVIAYLFDPFFASLCSLIGALVMFVTGASITPVYGLLTPLVPLVGAFFGSLTKSNNLAALLWSLIGLVSYLLFSGGTFLWIVFYFIPFATAFLAWRYTEFKTVNICVTTAISELVAMDLGSIFLLDFPGFLWAIIFPFAIYERTFAVIGSYILIRLLRRYLSTVELGF